MSSRIYLYCLLHQEMAFEAICTKETCGSIVTLHAILGVWLHHHNYQCIDNLCIVSVLV